MTLALIASLLLLLLAALRRELRLDGYGLRPPPPSRPGD
jgi:hypothetical protein